MKVTWLTQAGLLFENENITVMVDPYFSNSVAERDPKKSRRIPADDTYLEKTPDVILITHDHLDHLDPVTIEKIFHYAKKPITFLAPENAWKRLVSFGGKSQLRYA